MSNIGKKPIKIEDGVSVNIESHKAVVLGPKGTLEIPIPSGIKAVVLDDKVIVKPPENISDAPYWGLIASLLSNAIRGVTIGFEKKLELSGVGYRAQVVDSGELILNVGYTHPVKIKAPSGINISVAENIITVTGIDKKLVGDTASNIRAVKPPDPYKGKGIKYKDERLRRKVGKAAKAVGAVK